MRGWVMIAALAGGCANFAWPQAVPIAIAPVEGVTLTGAMDVANGKAVIAASGSITAGEHAATVVLPHRGNLRICATTKVTLAVDASNAAAPVATDAASGTVAASAPANPVVAQSDGSGLMMALERGALEANFATGKNSDVILTPDFRILISGPGVAEVQVRLGEKGDTCVDNRGPSAPYVTVSSTFDGGVYRVQADQRVMFQHGSLREVVDQEKESCGCPVEAPPTPLGNEFPLAQSAGLAPTPKVAGNVSPPGTQAAQATVQLSYDGEHPEVAKAAAEVPAVGPAVTATQPPPASAPKPQPKQGFFTRVGHFFRKIFGG
jgi:hypothetical protein